MNERIKELAEQCHHRYSEHNIDLEKFAELIVRECLDEIQYDDGATHVDELLPKHFGFEL
jgi:hypothetical protein